MQLLDCFQTFAIIDDQYDQAFKIKEEIERKHFWCSYYNPTDLSIEVDYPLADLLFLDLHLEENSPNERNQYLKTSMGVLRAYIGNSSGCFGIVLWTAHKEDIDVFKSLLLEHRCDFNSFPLFVVSLEKSVYISGDKSFVSLFTDLEKTLLDDDAARFFLTWNNQLKKAITKTIDDICDVDENNYLIRNQKILFLLKQLGKLRVSDPKNYGKRFTQDVYEGVNELLKSNVNDFSFDFSEQFKTINKPADWNSESGKIKIAETINTANAISICEKDDLWTGNVYLIKQTKGIPKLIKDYRNDHKGKEIINPKWKRLCMISTPSCDLSQGKNIGVKLVFGYVVKDDFKEIPDGDMFYKVLHIKGYGSVFFDFRQIKVIEQERLIGKGFQFMFRLKKQIVDDFLQKMAGYDSRVGTPLIQSLKNV